MQRLEFENIVPNLRPRLLAVGRQFFGNSEDAADVAQETLMRLWAMHEKIDERLPVEALAIRIAKNYCVSLWRERQHDGGSVEDYPHPAGGNNAQTGMEDEENRQCLQRAREHLPKAYRRLMQLKDEGWEVEEIVKITGIEEKSVRVMLSTARKRLVDELKKNLTR